MDRILSNDDLQNLRDYAAGRMTGERADAFELRLLADPALAREFERTAVLHEGLAELTRRGELPALLAPEPAWWARPGFAVAASGLLGAALLGNAWLYGQWRAAESRDAAAPVLAPAVAAPSELRLEHTRGAEADADARWSVAGEPRQLRLLVDVSPAGDVAQMARLSQLSDDGNRVAVLALGPLLPGTDGELALELNSRLLPPGRYELLVAPLVPGEFGDQRFVLQVTP